VGIRAPPKLLELAVQSLLRDEALAIAALEELPAELFPPLFSSALAGMHSQAVKAMVQAWPFPCLPLGALMKEHKPHLEIFQAAIDGLDVLSVCLPLSRRRWKLQVLDLRRNAQQDFCTVWSGTRAGVCSPLEPEVVGPVRKRCRVEGARAWLKQTSAPMEVLIDLCLKEGTPDASLSYLLKKVKQRRGSLRLCCQKLRVFSMPMQKIRKILKLVQLDSVQDLEVNCTWKLATLGRFAPHLGQMVNLRRLLLSHIHMTPHAAPGMEERCVSQLTSRFPSVVLCLKNPLETLSITNCLISEADLMHLSQCPSVSQLKDLSLSGVNLTSISSKPLWVLIEKASATLQDLDLDECGIMDSQFSALLPALSHCSQLTTFSFCGNPISMAVLESLLRHTVGLSKLSHVLYPAPLESYEDVHGTVHLGRLAHLHARLKQVLQELGLPSMVWFSGNPCPHCGDRTFYSPEPILCPCYMAA
uniref:Melanoma antigen preferentially expressed in tumors-like n=1 Tax=Monodon monoceros TaxID=40151 RepID=A0A8C6AFK7_MONMO